MRHRRRTAMIIAAAAVAAGLAAAVMTATPASSEPGSALPRVHADRAVYLDHVLSGTQAVPFWKGTGNENRFQSYDASLEASQPTVYRWRLKVVRGANGQVAFEIRNLGSDKCLTAPGDYRENTEVVQRTCSGGWGQRWIARNSFTGITDAVILSPALTPELALSPAAGGELNKQHDFRLALKRTGPYLNQLWRTRLVEADTDAGASVPQARWIGGR